VIAAALIVTACSSKRDRRDAAPPPPAESAKKSDVVSAFNAWAAGEDGAAASKPAAPQPDPLEAAIDSFNRKVRSCWQEPFGMPRLATVKLLVRFGPDGSVQEIAPRPDPGQEMLYRTQPPYLVMVAQTSQALRRCQPYESIRDNYPQLEQLEMVIDPRMFR
jgi:hypothetical protein